MNDPILLYFKESLDFAKEGKTMENTIREYASEYLRDSHKAAILPIVGYHESCMKEAQLIGYCVMGVPLSKEIPPLVLYPVDEDELPEPLIEWINTIMDLDVSLNGICEIMLAKKRAIIVGDMEIDYASNMGWENLIMEAKSTNLNEAIINIEYMLGDESNPNEFVKKLLSAILLGLATHLNKEIGVQTPEDFKNDFQDEWA